MPGVTRDEASMLGNRMLGQLGADALRPAVAVGNCLVAMVDRLPGGGGFWGLGRRVMVAAGRKEGAETFSKDSSRFPLHSCDCRDE